MKYKFVVLLFLSSSLNSNYLMPFRPYLSQFGQDKFLVEDFFCFKRQGVFFDIGAHDGISYSNTYFFEKELGWTGVCVEPQQDNYLKLKKNRTKSLCLNGCIASETGIKRFLKVNGPSEMLSGLLETYDPRHLDRAKFEVSSLGGSIEILEVQTWTLNEICSLHKIKKIDFLSIDTEGGELEILKSIDYNSIFIHVIVVENNYHNSEFGIFLKNKGFYLLRSIACDEIYVNSAWRN